MAEYNIEDPSPPTNPHNLENYNWGRAELKGRHRTRESWSNLDSNANPSSKVSRQVYEKVGDVLKNKIPSRFKEVGTSTMKVGNFSLKVRITPSGKKSRPINAEKVIESIKNISNFVTAPIRHAMVSNKLDSIRQRWYDRLDSKSKRENLKNSAKPILEVNENVTKRTNIAKKLIEGTKAGQAITKIASKPWVKRSLFIGGSIAALSMVEKAMTTFNPKPAIPEHYEKGYDVMRQTMTDFGSPVNLLKTASKTITPYYSTVRKSITTTTKTVTDRNIALFNSKNAIRHTRY